MQYFLLLLVIFSTCTIFCISKDLDISEKIKNELDTQILKCNSDSCIHSLIIITCKKYKFTDTSFIINQYK